MIRPSKKLVLETGQEFYGEGFGANVPRVSEVVFNTSVVGYQEIISDPSYADQIVVMTYPLIGNYGITDEDYESRSSCLGGLVVRECCDTPSNFRFTKTLEEELEERGVPGISGLDTRMLTKIIRDSGRPMAAIVDADMPLEEALELIASTPRPTDQLKRVSCRKRWVTRTPQHRFHVVAVDCGIKTGILRCLQERGCNVTIVPFNTTPEAILAFHPDGVLFSNGPVPGVQAPEVSALFGALKGQVPILGIGLGMEVIGLEYGARMKPMRDAKCSMRLRSCAGHAGFTQRTATSPSSRRTSPPHTGHVAGISKTRSPPVRFSGITDSIAGITSPAFTSQTWSPTRMSCRAIWSALCSVAREMVEPASSVGLSSATGVSMPVRPTCTVIDSTTVSARSGAYL